MMNRGEKIFGICSVIFMGLVCAVCSACVPGYESTEPEVKADSLYLEEWNSYKLEFRLPDVAEPFIPRPMMLPMADTHYFEIVEATEL